MPKKLRIDIFISTSTDKRSNELSGKMSIVPARKKDEDIYKFNFNNRVNCLMRKQSK